MLPAAIRLIFHSLSCYCCCCCCCCCYPHSRPLRPVSPVIISNYEHSFEILWIGNSIPPIGSYRILDKGSWFFDSLNLRGKCSRNYPIVVRKVSVESGRDGAGGRKDLIKVINGNEFVAQPEAPEIQRSSARQMLFEQKTRCLRHKRLLVLPPARFGIAGIVSSHQSGWTQARVDIRPALLPQELTGILEREAVIRALILFLTARWIRMQLEPEGEEDDPDTLIAAS